MDAAELRALVENITARPGHMRAMGTRVVAVEPGDVHLSIDAGRSAAEKVRLAGQN